MPCQTAYTAGQRAAPTYRQAEIYAARIGGREAADFLSVRQHDNRGPQMEQFAQGAHQQQEAMMSQLEALGGELANGAVDDETAAEEEAASLVSSLLIQGAAGDEEKGSLDELNTLLATGAQGHHHQQQQQQQQLHQLATHQLSGQDGPVVTPNAGYYAPTPASQQIDPSLSAPESATSGNQLNDGSHQRPFGPAAERAHPSPHDYQGHHLHQHHDNQQQQQQQQQHHHQHQHHQHQHQHHSVRPHQHSHAHSQPPQQHTHAHLQQHLHQNRSPSRLLIMQSGQQGDHTGNCGAQTEGAISQPNYAQQQVAASGNYHTVQANNGYYIIQEGQQQPQLHQRLTLDSSLYVPTVFLYQNQSQPQQHIRSLKSKCQQPNSAGPSNLDPSSPGQLDSGQQQPVELELAEESVVGQERQSCEESCATNNADNHQHQEELTSQQAGFLPLLPPISHLDHSYAPQMLTSSLASNASNAISSNVNLIGGPLTAQTQRSV